MLDNVNEINEKHLARFTYMHIDIDLYLLLWSIEKYLLVVQDISTWQ